MRTLVFKRGICLLLAVLACSVRLLAQYEEGQQSPAMIDSISCNQTLPSVPGKIFYTSLGEPSRKIRNIVRLKIDELANSSATGNPRIYIPSNFTANVTLKIEMWLHVPTSGQSADVTLTPTLTVSYDSAGGHKYIPVANLLLDTASYEQVQVTITQDTVVGLSNGWTKTNVLPLLSVENEMRVLRYYNLNDTATYLVPASFGGLYDSVNHSDLLAVSWSFPPSAHTNFSQLEYAWVENETRAFYNLNGVFDTSNLFWINSTRIDVDPSGNEYTFNYNVPTLFSGDPGQGGGKIYYRVRPVLKKNDGNLITGPWSSAQAFQSPAGHEPDLNWQATTSFAEDGKSKTVVQYYDGTLRPRQTVTKDNFTGNTIVAETIYDLQGRPNVQILPTPTISTAIQYFSNFNRFAGDTASGGDPARFFDLSVAGACTGAPRLDTTRGNGLYYSSGNPWIGVENSAKFIPDANGYAFTETRYMDDPTERVSVQGGVGLAHQIGNGHETNYFYGQPTQNELDALFGTEVGDAGHYFKNMVEDANGQMSISYVDMHGRTVATALAGAAPGKLASINTSTNFYPSSSGNLTDNLLTPTTNIIMGDSIQSLSTILVPAPTVYNFSYQLTPAILQQMNCHSQQVCFDCKYDLEISIRKEGCEDSAAVVRHYSNLQIVPAAKACDSSMGFTGDVITTPTDRISFSDTLGTGSWIVRKTLSINDSLFKIREDSALSAFLCDTLQNLIQQVTDSLTTATSCSVPAATQNCTSCLAQLGTYSAYKTKYLLSVGGDTSLSTDAGIHAQYTQDSLACADACGATNPALRSLAILRAEMLNDMIPYSGQYAQPTDSIARDTMLVAKYNIFVGADTTTFGAFGGGGFSRPFFRHPVAEPAGASAFYANPDGTVDVGMYPSGQSTDLSVLNTISADSFATIFSRNWASQLIFYHPEYPRLRFAEDTLASSFSWMDSVMNCDSYATASARGYLAPLTHDPYFINNYVPGDKTTMGIYLTHNLNPNPSSGNTGIWLLANQTAMCDTTLPATARQSCLASLNRADTSAVDPSATAAQKDAIWQFFRGMYIGFRNDMLMNYIDNHEAGSLSAAAASVLQKKYGKQMRFATAQNQADQNGWTWWAAAASTAQNSSDSVQLIDSANAYLSRNTTDQCIAQRPFWQARLMQCDELQQFLANPADTARLNAMLGVILDSMVMVCQHSINPNNPSGASNVNPVVLPFTPASFENIINHVFAQDSVGTLPGNHYFCNPYSIDYPKPFNANPPLQVETKASVDTCNCNQFIMLKTAAKAAGYDTSSRSSVNAYLLANYNDTLSLPLWNGLQRCASWTWNQAVACFPVGEEFDSCVYAHENISLGALVEIPSFLDCGYVKPCLSCETLQSYAADFRTLYPAYDSVPYTNGATTDTSRAAQNALWARYLNYRTGFSKTANEYAAAYLNCGYGLGATDLVLTDRNGQPPSGSTAPFLYTASSSISFETNYTSLPGDEFVGKLSGYLTSSGSALCALDQPVTYVPLPDTTGSNPCAQVQEQAAFIATLLFQRRQSVLIANFDSLYRAKCLGAQRTEVFYATYQPAEYHYTLYYYDQAGNLVKTLPPAAVRPNFDTAYLSEVQAARAAGTDLRNGTNIENMATQYRYNTLNQVVAQNSPDGGESHFWYDRLGRLAVSQNARQAGDPSYSYTIYDALGRITEVGQKPQATAMSQTTSQDTTALQNWLNDLSAGGSKQQITRTVYDIPYPSFTGIAPIAQLNLRNRVAYSEAIDVDNTDTVPYRTASFYSYDVHGNVDSLLQDYGTGSVMSTANRFKLITYDFDLISGKVNMVSYQPGQADRFYQQYSYDAENRITGVRTSRDSLNWQNDASYSYYRHGPLARVELGELGVQGVDYGYTVQGWLKSINPSWVSAASDQWDSDGIAGQLLFARDAYKLNLNYFDDGTYTDYQPIAPPSGYIQGNGLPSLQKNNLYNGNIGSQAVDIRKLAKGTATYAGPLIYNYRYDQLNRIASMDPWAANGSFAPTGSGPMADYAERYGYDPNGNILTLNRHGTTGTGLGLNMDSLSYEYIYQKTGGVGAGEYVPGQTLPTDVDHLTNQLGSIRDAVTSSGYNDIKNQIALNYKYDAIGNLVADSQARVSNVNWSVYGKILNLTDSGNLISFTYDAAGNRISKTAGGITTWYVRDAQGNVMAVYEQGDASHNSGALTQTEVHLYGSSRLGMQELNVNCTSPALSYPYEDTLVRGSKLFELTNHLGNVLATISDKKLQHTSDGTTVDYYNADVITAQDYYSFGMPMPGRNFNAANAGSYRYGFNGKEQDPEIKGPGDQIDYGSRVYDPRLGKFLSVDLLARKYPMLSPFQYASNRPIDGLDLDGLEYLPYHRSMYQLQYSVNTETLTAINGTKTKVTTESVVVNTVYANIPSALQDPKTNSFKYVSGGPVTAWGRDWDADKDGPVITPQGKYYNKGPEFNGLPPGSAPEPSDGMKPVGKYYGDDVMVSTNLGKTGTAANAGQQAYDIGSNLSHIAIENALSNEYRQRTGFYAATNMIDLYLDHDAITNLSMSTASARASLINFLTDGTLNTGEADRLKDVPNGKTHVEYNAMRKNLYFAALTIAYVGIQIIQQQTNGQLKLQPETISEFQKTIQKYKANGGGNEFDDINKNLNLQK